MLVVRGRVDEWRIARMNAYLIHCSLIDSKDRVSMLGALPLPFDDELGESSDVQSAEQAMIEYNNYRQYLENADPLKIKNAG